MSIEYFKCNDCLSLFKASTDARVPHCDDLNIEQIDMQEFLVRKNQELEHDLARVTELLKGACEVIEFYGDRFSWDFSRHPIYEMHPGLIVDDSSFMRFKEADGDEFEQPCGGKRAREFLAKPEIKEVLK